MVFLSNEDVFSTGTSASMSINQRTIMMVTIQLTKVRDMRERRCRI